MKKTILIILSGLLTIITICGFVISYGALLTTAVESKLEYQWGWFNTKFIWPLTVDFALITFECALFYVILFQPHLRKMLISLVVAFTALTVYFNVIHGLPSALPVGFTQWMKAIEAGLAWSLPPIVQCLGVLVLSKIFHGIVQNREMEPVEGIIENKYPNDEPVNATMPPPAPAPVTFEEVNENPISSSINNNMEDAWPVLTKSEANDILAHEDV